MVTSVSCPLAQPSELDVAAPPLAPPRRAHARPSRAPMLALLAWSLYSAAATLRAHAAALVLHPSDGWGPAVSAGLIDACLWLPIVALALVLARPGSLASLRPIARHVLRVGAFAGALGWRAAALGAIAALESVAARNSEVGAGLSAATGLIPVLGDAVLLVLIAGLASSWHEHRRSEQLSMELADARLATLATQLRPHFLLNALNTAAELVHEDPEAADGMLAALGHLLRHSLRHDGTREIPLRDEVALLRDYVAVEHARFGDRLTVEWAIAPDSLGAHVPPLLLQPLVENAVRHGIAPSVRRSSRSPYHAYGTVRIASAREGSMLRLTVTDDGVGLGRREPIPADGVGLTSVRARLQALYGARHSMEILSRVDRGTTVTLRLPAHGASGEHDAHTVRARASRD